MLKLDFVGVASSGPHRLPLFHTLNVPHRKNKRDFLSNSNTHTPIYALMNVIQDHRLGSDWFAQQRHYTHTVSRAHPESKKERGGTRGKNNQQY